MQYTVRTILTTTTAVAILFACVVYGVRIGGAGGGVISGIVSGIALLFLSGAMWCLAPRRYAAAAFLLCASLVTATIGYYTMDFHTFFSAPEIRLNRNYQNLTDKLRENNAFKNVELRIQREAIGGCIILTGVVDSTEQLYCLHSICASYGRNAIENRVRVGAVTK
jgi:hypothetical protein